MAKAKARSVPLKTVSHTLTKITESAPGIYQATLTSGSKPQLINITAQINGVPLADVQTKVTLIADESTATLQTSSLQIITNGSLADDTDANQIRAVVVDAYGNKLSGVQVNLQ